MPYQLRGSDPILQSLRVNPTSTLKSASTVPTENEKTKELLGRMSMFIKQTLDGVASVDETQAMTKDVLTHAKEMTLDNKYGTAFYIEAVNIAKAMYGLPEAYHTRVFAHNSNTHKAPLFSQDYTMGQLIDRGVGLDVEVFQTMGAYPVGGTLYYGHDKHPNPASEPKHAKRALEQLTDSPSVPLKVTLDGLSDGGRGSYLELL